MNTPGSFTQCFQWHPAVHDAWGQEDLWFWFFGFQVYDRTRVFEALPDLLEELGVSSYVMYELSGQYDLLVRAWVPRSMPKLERRVQELEQVLGGLVETIKIDEVVHHWVWEESERARVGKMKRPEDDVIELGKPLRELELLNRAQRAHRLGPNSEDFTDDERDELDKLLRDYQKERLISYPPYESGIKFVVQVQVPDRRTQQSRALGDALENTLCAVLDEAYGVIWDRSLYRSRSGHIQFIFLGRVRLRPDVDDEGNETHPFHEIAPRLLDRVSQAATLSGRRTYTFFLPLESFIAYRDELSLPPAPKALEPQALELFGKREGHYFEAKGSAWTDLDGWLTEEIEEIPAGNRKDSLAIGSLVRAVVAMLNSDGGTILLGALEPSKYGKYPRCKKLPKQENFYCCGIDHDLAGEDWDDFVRALWDVLTTRIEPAPSARWIKIWDQRVHNKTVGVITIALPDDWYWVVGSKKDRAFVVRENAQTKTLNGRDAIRYQETQKRADRRQASSRQRH